MPYGGILRKKGVKIMDIKLYEALQRVIDGKCPFCNKEVHIEDMRDIISQDEFRLSGLCQECQDDFFGK